MVAVPPQAMYSSRAASLNSHCPGIPACSELTRRFQDLSAVSGTRHYIRHLNAIGPGRECRAHLRIKILRDFERLTGQNVDTRRGCRLVGGSTPVDDPLRELRPHAHDFAATARADGHIAIRHTDDQRANV